MDCPVCKCQFCWLCLHEITDLHYMSPTGCTFWGTTVWSKTKRRIVLCCLVPCSPVIILCLCLLSIPAVVVFLPYKTYKILKASQRKIAKNLIFRLFLTFNILVLSPIIGVMSAFLLLPVLIFIFYILIPIEMIKTYKREYSESRFEDAETSSLQSIEIKTLVKNDDKILDSNKIVET